MVLTGTTLHVERLAQEARIMMHNPPACRRILAQLIAAAAHGIDRSIGENPDDYYRS